MTSTNLKTAWAATWGTRFNSKKCYILSINQKSNNFYQLSKHFLQQVPDNPYLGVTISEDLKWSTHITNITKKANTTLGFLRRNLKHCPESCRKTAYLALVRSTLEYSSIIWDPHLQKDLNKIEKVQRQATRFITGDYTSRDPGCITQMMTKLNLPSLQDRRKANRLVYNVVEGLVPALPSQNFLTPVRDSRRKIHAKQFHYFKCDNFINNHSTNNTKCFKPFNCKSDLFKNSFFSKDRDRLEPPGR